MNVKMYILSLAAIAVIGCGGSNSGSCCKGGIKSGEVGKTTIAFTADENGTSNKKGTILDSNGNETGSVVIKKSTNTVPDGTETPACQDANNPCEVKVIQESHCPKKLIANPILRYTICYGRSAVTYAERHASDLNYDPTKQMIVYGGAVILQSDDFDKVDASLTIKGIACGMEVRTEKPAGFSNKGHKVFALVKILNACGDDVKDSQWTQEVTIDENGNFTLDLEGLEFGDDNQVEVLLFSVKDADITGSTGVTGSF